MLVIQSQQGKAKAGTLTISSKTLDTPACLSYTRMGSIPHLTPEQVSKIPSATASLIAIENFISLVTTECIKEEHRRKDFCPIQGFEKHYSSLHAYLGLSQDTLLWGDLRDVYEWIHENPDLPFTDKFVCTCSLSG